MGCGESKHAVATTESFSNRKKLNCNSSKKVQSAEEPYKATDVDENSNKIRSDTSNVVQKKETTSNATQHESFFKQGKDTNMSINDIEMDLPSESKEDPKKKDVLVTEDVTPNKDKGNNQEISLESQKEYDDEIKFDENLSAQHESLEKLSSCEEYKQDIIFKGDNELDDDKIKLDGNLFPQNENNEKFDSNEGNQQEIVIKGGDGKNLAKSDENVSPQSESVDNVALGKEEKQDIPIERDDNINKKSNLDENFSPQLESTKKFSSNEEGKKNRLVQKDNNSKNEEEEKNEDGILENLNEVIKDIKNENASIEMETTPNVGQDDVMDSTV